MTVAYRGGSGVVNALQNGTASSRALAAADLDGDAAPDLVAGFANGGTGIVTVQKSNPEGFAPNDDSVFQHMHEGYNPPSLLPTIETYQVSSPVDFLSTAQEKSWREPRWTRSWRSALADIASMFSRVCRAGCACQQYTSETVQSPASAIQTTIFKRTPCTV